MILFSCFHTDCFDLLPAWLRHYKKMGVDEFRVVFHGTENQWEQAQRLAEGHALRLTEFWKGDFSDDEKRVRLNSAIQHCIGEWVMTADMDEFVELPCRSVKKTIQLLQVMGGDCLYAPFLQRVASDGLLPKMAPGDDPWEVCPFASSQLCAHMGANIFYGKYPLFLVRSNTSIQNGNHYPPNGVSSEELPLRGVTHHFKWRRAFLDTLSRRKTLHGTNAHEMQQYGAYLMEHGGVLPLDGAFPCSRERLFDLGLLRKPASGALRNAARLSKGRAQRLSGELRRLRICIVTWELMGQRGSGGIGTSNFALGELLAAAGHEVTMAHIPMFWTQPANETLVRRYAESGLRLESIPRTTAELRGGSRWATTSYACWQWLAAQPPFDVVHFAESLGLGAHTVRAKHCGLGFEQTRICVTLHGSHAWGREGNLHALMMDDYDCDALENESARLSDVVISPSHAMLQWWKEHGRPLPAEAFARPNVLRNSCRVSHTRSTVGTPLREAVFFGRIEERKGIVLFCDALDELTRNNLLPPGFRATFLGRTTTVRGMSAADYLQHRSSAWNFPWKLADTLSMPAAVEYLLQPGCFAVIPSLVDNYPNTVLECLGAGIPFLATTLEGVLEMVAREHHATHLVERSSTALAGALERVLKDGLSPAKSSVGFDALDREWIEWHEREAHHAAGESPQDKTAANAGSLTVCITAVSHGDLLRTLKCMACQSVMNFDVVAVSSVPGDEAQAKLESWPFPVKFIGAPSQNHPSMMNIAASHASGKTLLFLRDSHAPANALVETMTWCMMKTGAEIVACGSNCTLNDGQTTTEFLQSPCHLDLSAGILLNIFGGPHFLVTRAAFDRIGPISTNPGLDGHECWHFFLHAMSNGCRVEALPALLVEDFQPQTAPVRYPEALIKPVVKHWPSDAQKMALLAHQSFTGRTKQANGRAGRNGSAAAGILNLATDSGVTAQFGSGWYDAESKGRWSGTDGSMEGEILLHARRPATWAGFTAEVCLFQPADSLSVELNGKNILESFTGSRLHLPALSLQQGNNRLVFVSRLKPLTRGTRDARPLSAFFSKVVLTPTGCHGGELVDWKEWHSRQSQMLPPGSVGCIANTACEVAGLEIAFGEGWHAFEGTHRWSGTLEEGCAIQVFAHFPDMEVLFSGKITPHRRGDRLEVAWNGNPIASVIAPGHVTLGPLKTVAGINSLHFRPDFPPTRAGIDDDRRLSHSFCDLAFRPLQTTAAPASVASPSLANQRIIVAGSGMLSDSVSARHGQGWYQSGECFSIGRPGEPANAEIILEVARFNEHVGFFATASPETPGDALTILLNGKLIASNCVGGKLELAPLRVNRGKNRLVFQVQSASPGTAPGMVTFSNLAIALCGRHGGERADWEDWLARQREVLPAGTPGCIAASGHRQAGLDVAFGKGWHDWEGTHRWSGADPAGCTIQIYSPFADVEALFTGEARPFTTGDSLAVSLNANPAGEITGPGPFQFGPLALNRGINTLAFAPRLPAASPGPDDPRPLSFSFSKLAFAAPAPSPVSPRISYMICSTPRSGSTLLSEGLAIAGAGFPTEYLTDDQEDWLNTIASCRYPPVLDKLIASKSSGGVFGIKTQFEAFEDFIHCLRQMHGNSSTSVHELIERHLPGIRFIHLRRGDTLRQAVSLVKAINTGHWHEREGGESGGHKVSPVFNRREIAYFKQLIESWDAAWTKIFAELGIAPLCLNYEEIAADYAGTIQRVIAWLGLPPASPELLQKPPLRRQADTLTEEWVARFEAGD